MVDHLGPNQDAARNLPEPLVPPLLAPASGPSPGQFLLLLLLQFSLRRFLRRRSHQDRQVLALLPHSFPHHSSDHLVIQRDSHENHSADLNLHQVSAHLVMPIFRILTTICGIVS